MLVMAPNTGVQWAANEHHYGGEHRRLSVVDRLGERVERRLRVSYDA
jgi:hypothetical protein